ncbi:MAG TPA: hypothetical protein VK721_05755 [Solirubrobacteraceae bacterium]|jgi:hypothetical protein|nr:hypothetical protein [Solirubrobacteraceae bacterium]
MRSSCALGLCAAAVAFAGAAFAPAGAVAGETRSASFTTTGQGEFIVPAGVDSVEATLIGGHGGLGNISNGAQAPGGAGASAVAMLSVSSGELLFVEVAGAGGSSEQAGRGGYGGGGKAGGHGGGGGGASDVRTDEDLPSSRLVVAAGGGGGGGNGGETANPSAAIAAGSGGEGGQSGQNGTAAGVHAHGGEGGKAGNSGGAAGENSSETAATPGQLALGGQGGTQFAGGGGGGGGGLFGGGGGGGGIAFAESVSPFSVFSGGGGGGGGGSSGVPAGVTSAVLVSSGSTTQPPSVTFTWTAPPPAAVTAAPGSLTGTSATLTGTVNPDGSVISGCQFTLSPAPPAGATIPCPQQIGAGSTPVAVSAPVGGLSPATTYTVTLTATSAQGSGTGTAVTFTTPSIGAPTDTGGHATLTVTGLRLSPTRFRRGRHPATVIKAKAPPSATTISFALSEAASVTLSLEAVERGVLVGHKCTAVSKAHHRGRRCTRHARLSHGVTLTAPAGGDRISFDGILTGGMTLPAGTYRLTLTAVAGAARASAAQHPVFALLGH